MFIILFEINFKFDKKNDYTFYFSSEFYFIDIQYSIILKYCINLSSAISCNTMSLKQLIQLLLYIFIIIRDTSML